MPSYRICGLTVISEMDLPGVIPGPAVAESEVRIRRRPLPERLGGATASGPVWDLDARGFLLRLPGIGRFLASGGRDLDVDPEPGVPLADAMPFLLGTAFGALLHQRGGLVLHAAAVADEGRAFAFCGISGRGKSTLAAALCRDGCTALCDDICAVGMGEGGRAVVWPDGRQLKIWQDGIAHLGLEGRRGDAVRSRIGKFYVDPPSGAIDAPVPLAAIYLLREAKPPHLPGIERLSLVDSAQALLNESYRPRLALAAAGPGRQVALTAATLRHVPVFRLTRPKGLDRLGETVADLRRHWGELAP